jgi:MFS family permease
MHIWPKLQGVLGGFLELHPTTRRLLVTRALRSIGQGALVVDFALYLNSLQWSAVAIGGLLSASGLFGAGLNLFIGTLSDRFRRKPPLMIYEVIALVTSLAVIFSSETWILVVAAIFGGFGRGANGAAGPFSPAEQAWLAEEVLPKRRGRVYSLNAALGFFGMGAGALIAILPPAWASILPGPLAYRPLFALVTLAALGGLFLLGGAQERRRTPKLLENDLEKLQDDTIRRQENQVLTKMVLINGFNGVAIGLTGPLMSYWFLQRFGVGAESIAPVMAAAFIATGFLSIYTGGLTERIGIISSVVWERLIGVFLLAILPLMPTYGLASVIYVLRSVLTRGPSGAQQALTVSLVRDERRGLASSLNAISFQLPRSVGPAITGYLLDLGQFGLPFYVGAAFQGVYLVLYRRVFRKYEPAREDVG